MTAIQPNEVHQAYFGWSHDTGELTMLAHSFRTDQESNYWCQRLTGHVRIQAMGAAVATPSSTLAYLDFKDGTVAMVRRIDSGYGPGRNDSHALIGVADTLTVLHALGLSTWEGWTNRPERSWHSVRADDIAKYADLTDLAHRASQLEPRLATILPALLARPAEPLSIIGCPDEDRLAVVWGLHMAADKYLRGTGVTRRWSFSTYERRHDTQVDALPEIVFLPAVQKGTAPVDRTIVDLRGPVEASHGRRELAVNLLASAFHGSPQPIAEPAPESVPDAVQSARTNQGATVAIPRERGFTAGPNERPQPHVAPQPDRQPPPRQQTGVRPSMPTSLPELDHMVKELQRELRYRPDRRPIRDMVDPAALDTIVGMVEKSAQEKYFRPLLQALYGPDFSDLRDPSAREHAQAVIRTTRSKRLAGELVAAGAEDPLIVETGIQRWVNGPQPPNHSPRQGGRFRLPRRRARVLATVAAAAVLGMAFLLGLVIDGPDTVAATATPARDVTPTVTEKAAPTFQFQVADVPKQTEGKSVFSFVQRGEERFPQQPCGRMEGIWICPVPLTSVTADGSLVALPVTSEERKAAFDAAAKQAPLVIGGTPLPAPE